MWGTFWVWDARLTSVLILFFIYLGALRFFATHQEIGAIFVCIGLINIPIIKFSVNWWNTLHQPSMMIETRQFIVKSYILSLKNYKKRAVRARQGPSGRHMTKNYNNILQFEKID